MALFAESISKSLKSLLLDQGQADLTVAFDSEEIPCHSFLLSACSTYFRNLKRPGLNRSFDNRVFLHGISVATFKQVKHILYTGDDIVTIDNMTDIWLASRQLGIEFLFERCERFIAGDINWCNVFDIWQKASDLKSDILIKKCEHFLNENISLENYYNVYSDARKKNARQILKNVKEFMIKNFEKLSKDLVCKLSFDTVLEIVESHDLVVKSEDAVLDFILKWIELQPSDPVISTKEYSENHYAEEIGNIKSKDFGSINAEGIANKLEEAGYTRKYLRKKDDIAFENYFASEDKPKLIPKRFVGKVWSSVESATISSGDSLSLQTQADAVDTRTMSLHNTVSVYHKPSASPKPKKRVDKHDQLVMLLKAARVYLASRDSLRKVYSHPAMDENQAAKDIIHDAITHQTDCLKEGQTILGALHRKCSELVNVVIFSHDSGFYALSVADGQFFTFQQCTVFRHNVQFLYYNNELYATGTENPHTSRNKFCRFSSTGYWPLVTEFDGPHLSLVTHDNLIHIFKRSSGEIFRLAHALLGRKRYLLSRVTRFQSFVKTESAISFQGMLLVFCSEINESQDLENTVVYKVDPVSQDPIRVKSFPGPAKNMITFRGENKTFVLQSNGGLWEIIETSGDLEFIFILKLWSVFDLVLYGAVAANQALYVFASKPTKDFKEKHCVTSTNGRFRSIFYYMDIEESDHCSNVVSAVLPKSCLRKL